jgi:hypothetical protein
MFLQMLQCKLEIETLCAILINCSGTYLYTIHIDADSDYTSNKSDIYSKIAEFLYKMSQEEWSIFWEVIVSAILSKKVYIVTDLLKALRNSGHAVPQQDDATVLWKRFLRVCACTCDVMLYGACAGDVRQQ